MWSHAGKQAARQVADSISLSLSLVRLTSRLRLLVGVSPSGPPSHSV